MRRGFVTYDMIKPFLKGGLEMVARTGIYGVGINDADYVTSPKNGDGQSICKFYSTWKSMFVRSYSKKFQEKQPTYIGCSVAKEWHSFSSFRSWMANQIWEGMALDKDILFPGNLIYSSETCVFVPRFVNNSISVGKKSILPLGVFAPKKMKGSVKKFAACGCDGNGKTFHLGHFGSEIEAHSAWQKYKISALKECISKYNMTDSPDYRVVNAISKRVKAIESDLENGRQTLLQ